MFTSGILQHGRSLHEFQQQFHFFSLNFGEEEEEEQILCVKQTFSVTSHLNTFTAIVDLSRSNFSIARAPLFQLKSAM